MLSGVHACPTTHTIRLQSSFKKTKKIKLVTHFKMSIVIFFSEKLIYNIIILIN